MTETPVVGVCTTVSTADPDALPDVPVMVAEPTPTPVMTPEFASIVATDVFDDDQVTGRLAGVVTACAWPVAPLSNVSLAGVSVTVTPVVGVWVTDVVLVPETPDAVAVIVVVPVSAPPVTRPEPLTLAMLELADVQLMVRVTVRPNESMTVAVSCLVAPWATVSAAGVTVTD